MAFPLDFSGEVKHGHLKVEATKSERDIIKLVMATRFSSKNEASLSVEGYVLIVKFQRGQQLHEVVGWQFDGVLSSGQKCGNTHEVGVIEVVLHPVGFTVSDVRNGQLPGACFDLIVKENKPIIFVIVEPDVGLINTIEYGVRIATNVLVVPSSREEIHIQIKL